MDTRLGRIVGEDVTYPELTVGGLPVQKPIQHTLQIGGGYFVVLDNADVIPPLNELKSWIGERSEPKKSGPSV